MSDSTDETEFIINTPKHDIECLRIKLKQLLFDRKLYPDIYVFLERYKQHINVRIFLDFLFELYNQIENPITDQHNDDYILPLLLMDELINNAKYNLRLHYVVDCLIDYFSST